jgi:hypothetical protein
LTGDHLEAKSVIDRAQTGDYAEWPTWLPIAIDLIVQLQDDEPLRDAAAALRREIVPKTSPMVLGQAARLDALLAASSGATARAGSHWSAAIEVVSKAGMVFDAAALKLELFEHVPEYRGALAGLHTAIDTFTGLRATPWLARARGALQAAAVVPSAEPTVGSRE